MMTTSYSKPNTSKPWSCPQPSRSTNKSRKLPDKRSYGMQVSPPPSLMTKGYQRRKDSSTMMDESTYRKKPLSKARSFPKAMITSLPVTQGLRRRRSLYSINSGGQRSRRTSKPTSKDVKLVNERSPARRPRQPHYTRTQSQKDHGRIFPSTWSLDSPTCTDTTRSL